MEVSNPFAQKDGLPLPKKHGHIYIFFFNKYDGAEFFFLQTIK